MFVSIAGMVSPQPLIVTNAPDQAPHDHAVDVPPVPRLSVHAATVAEIFPDKGADRIEHVCAGIEQEATASDGRLLTPCVCRCTFPALPD
ncbi:MAG: hypothetical protein U0528_14035 [Anaerolineae bacterium]